MKERFSALLKSVYEGTFFAYGEVGVPEHTQVTEPRRGGRLTIVLLHITLISFFAIAQKTKQKKLGQLKHSVYLTGLPQVTLNISVKMLLHILFLFQLNVPLND